MLGNQLTMQTIPNNGCDLWKSLVILAVLCLSMACEGYNMIFGGYIVVNKLPLTIVAIIAMCQCDNVHDHHAYVSNIVVEIIVNNSQIVAGFGPFACDDECVCMHMCFVHVP